MGGRGVSLLVVQLADPPLSFALRVVDFYSFRTCAVWGTE